MKSSRSALSGFTLTELLVVMSVVGIMAAIAIPSFKSLTQSQRVKNASFELYSSLSLARSEAIKRNSNVTLTADVNADLEVSWSITGTSASGVVDIRTQDYIKGIKMDVDNLTDMGLTYRRNGRAMNIDASSFADTPTFEIYPADTTAADSPYTRCITLELSGMPRSRQGACP